MALEQSGVLLCPMQLLITRMSACITSGKSGTEHVSLLIGMRALCETSLCMPSSQLCSRVPFHQRCCMQSGALQGQQPICSKP